MSEGDITPKPLSDEEVTLNKLSVSRKKLKAAEHLYRKYEGVLRKIHKEKQGEYESDSSFIIRLQKMAKVERSF